MSPRDALRIAMFTYSTQPRGGVVHAVALAEALHAAGHQVVLYALGDAQHPFVRPPRCPAVLVPVASGPNDIVSFVRRAIAAYVDCWDVSAPQFDIYHSHDGISANALATIVQRGHIARFVRTVHHLDNFASAELNALQDRSVQLAARCFVVSKIWRERLARAYACNAAVVPNGVDTERFAPVSAPQRRALRTALGYDDGPLYVTIGGIEARKNTLALLEAFALVHVHVPAARLIIAGGASVLSHAEYCAEFWQRAAALKLSDTPALTVVGVQTDAQIVELLQAASALVFPSLVEGFGLVVLEALACGTPVVTSALAPFTEYLGPGDALLVDPHDCGELAAAMLVALEPATVTNAAALGPALAQRFSWQAAAGVHVREYDSFRRAFAVPANA